MGMFERAAGNVWDFCTGRSKNATTRYASWVINPYGKMVRDIDRTWRTGVNQLGKCLGSNSAASYSVNNSGNIYGQSGSIVGKF